MIEKTEPTAASASSSAPLPKRKRGILARLRLLFLWLVLLLLLAMHRPVFPWLVRGVLKYNAWQSGATVSIGRIEGSFWEPVAVHDLLWTYRAESGAVTCIEVRHARGWLSWSNIFPVPVAGWIQNWARKAGLHPTGDAGQWFSELELSDVTAKLSLSGGQGVQTGPLAHWLRNLLPLKIAHPGHYTVRNADLIIERGGDWLRASGLHFSLSDTSRGVMRAARVAMSAGGVRKDVTGVRAWTSLEGSTALVSGMRLAPDVMLRNFTVSLSDFADGRLAFTAELAAFGGDVSAEAEVTFHDRRLKFDASGNFSKVSVAGAAAFFGLGDAAGGVLNAGSFTFRGEPSDFAKCEATLRFDAGAFQWETRQWDSLVVGLSLVDQRLQIHQFNLRQGENQLALKGTMALPQPGARWWDRQFDLKVDADIRNLTDLSALLLPEFKYTAGQLFIRGAVSGSGVQGESPANYEGQMVVSGSSLQWRTAPVDNLSAALWFHERELRVINMQLAHGGDILRGSGRISLADGSYGGEWRLSTADLGVYRSLLSPHILPTPLGGAVEATWSGSGGTAKHAGNFTAKLGRFRLLGPTGTLPLDAEASGEYKAGEFKLNKFQLSENGMTLSGGATVIPGTVDLRELRVIHNGRACLEGAALVPLDLWQRWPDVNFVRLLNDTTASRVHLRAEDLDLRAVSRLTGVDWPIGGMLTGTLDAEGALGGLKLGGSVQFTGGIVPLDWKGGVVREVTAQFTLDGSTIQITQATGKSADGDFGISGRLSLANPRAPAIEAAGSGMFQSQRFNFTVQGDAAKPVITTEGHAPFSGNAPVAPAPPAPPAPAPDAPPAK